MYTLCSLYLFIRGFYLYSTSTQCLIDKVAVSVAISNILFDMSSTQQVTVIAKHSDIEKPVNSLTLISMSSYIFMFINCSHINAVILKDF